MTERESSPGVVRVDKARTGDGLERWQPGRGVSLEAHQAAQIAALVDLLNLTLDHLIVHDETCRLLSDIPAALRKIGVK